MAFVFGAATAAFAGSIYGAVQTGAFPGDFDVGLLITIYAIVILGGAGSLAGVVVAAIVVNAVPELLRDPNQAEWVFYVGIAVVVFYRLRPWPRLVGVVAGTIGLGFAVHAIADAAWPRLTAGSSGGEGALAHAVGSWVLLPSDPKQIANFAFVILIAAVLGLTLIHGVWRTVALVPTIYLARLRVGEPPHPADGRCDSFPPAGSVAGRPDERSATRAVRNRAGGDRLMAQKLLELRNLNKSFGGLTVISDLDLHVNEDEIVSVIGPNGAGKTTLFNLITGVYGPDDGEILLDGESIVGLEPHQVTNRGVARTFQTLRLFLNMSVRENVMAVQYGRTKATVLESMFRLPRARREEKEIRARAEEKLSFFGQRLVGYRWDQPAYSLSYANRRRLEIARAMATEPRILLLDEPAAGMNPSETHEIAELIGKLREDGGYTILVIEHDMHVVEGISDRVIALDHGIKIAEGSFDAVATDPRVVEAYLGLRKAETK